MEKNGSVLIREATSEQLRAYIAATQLHASDHANREELIAVILQASPGAESIHVSNARTRAYQRRKTQEHGPSESTDKVTIVISPPQDDDPDNIAQVSVNGVMYHIHRGVPVAVGIHIYEALQNARVTQTFQDPERPHNADGTPNIVVRHSLAYPITVVGYPPAISRAEMVERGEV